MNSNTNLDEAKPELVKVWVDATREYGKYSCYLKRDAKVGGAPEPV